MKTLDPTLQKRLSSDATTLCHCWKITRSDGVTLGFTDYDDQLSVDGLVYDAATGLSGSEAVSEAGLAAGTMDIVGVLSSGRIEEADLLGGRYDNAYVDVYLVDWQQPAAFVHLRRMLIGEITLTGDSFRAEMRSVASLLNNATGRNFVRHCDAELGDGRCTFQLSAPDYQRSGTVTAFGDSTRFYASGLNGHSANWFSLGALTWTAGANSGTTQIVRSSGAGTSAEIILRTAPSGTITVGDTFTVVAGCDKSFQTCCDKFSNSANFRGFPFMPGNDFVLSYPKRDSGLNDGSALIS